MESGRRPPFPSTPSLKLTPIPVARRIGGGPQSDGSPSLSRTPRPGTPRVVHMNDDEEERRQRHLNKNMCTMISPGCHTPRGVSGLAHSDQSRAVESSSSSLTNAQLAEHYANCIKLSSENKISAKNAFGLHLIDHMLKLLKMRGEMSNFQIASSTLDASTKIYAGRVDSIYNDIFKVLGGLGRDHAKEKNKDEEQAEQEGDEDSAEAGVRKRGKKAKKSATSLTVETDPSNLDLANFDLAPPINPLFKKTSAAFDEGGAEGLLLHNLNVQDDGCTLTLDPSVMPVMEDEPFEGCSVEIDKELFDLAALESRQICPTFANFKFNSSGTEGTWDLSNVRRIGDEETGGVARSNGGVDQGADFTMLDCPPSAPDYGAQDDAGFEDAPALDADADDQAFNPAAGGNTTVLGVCSDNQVAQFLPAAGAREQTSAPMAPGMGDLCLTDLIVPSEYSYFPPAVMASWAGPQHWKFRPRSVASKPEAKEVTKSRKKKAPVAYKVDFKKVPEKSAFGTSRASTRLSKAALSKLDSSLTTLPRNTQTDPDVLSSLFCQPKWKVRRQKRVNGVVDEGLEGDWYNYSNANDQLNYCPMGADDSEESEGGLGAVEDEGEFFQEFVPDSEMPASQVSTELGGENLVAPPRKVDQVQVNYARSSKKVDVKKLKGKIWDIISRPKKQTDSSTTEQTDSSEETTPTPTASGTSVSSTDGGVSFTSLYSDLPTLISANMAKNISVPICFVCLLHLANEKALKLGGSEDMSDFDIFTT